MREENTGLKRVFFIQRCVNSSSDLHHGPHLRSPLFPLRAVLGRAALPPALPCRLSRHSHHDALQNLPGLPAQLPQDIQLYPLPRPPRQPRRAHLQVFSREPRQSISIQLCGECWLWAGGGESAADRSTRCGRHLL